MRSTQTKNAALFEYNSGDFLKSRHIYYKVVYIGMGGIA